MKGIAEYDKSWRIYAESRKPDKKPTAVIQNGFTLPDWGVIRSG